MRLASFLPMLLLAFSFPVAAQNCNIFDLTATVVQADPLTCEFFVSLNFEHSGTSNQFIVSGNGTNYGTFPYGQLPLVLGPFTASPNGPSFLEFLVKDAEFPDCKDATDILIPVCVPPCSITDLQVVPGQCDPLGLTYSLFVNFKVHGNIANSFTVFANGNLIGNFSLQLLPLQLPAFPASGNPVDVIKICIANQPDCCETLEFDAPICGNQPCSIVDLSVQTGDCISDSSYQVIIDFDAIGPVPADSFALRSNGHFLGMFGLNQLPLKQVVKWDGGPKDKLEVCVVNLFTNCCKTIEYLVPDCLHFNPCGISDLVVKPDTCTSDSTFLAILNFSVNDPAAVDSFELWANGEFLGHFGMNQLPLSISDFPWNGLIFNHVRVCTGSSPVCCKEFQFLAPACLPFGPCEITDIFLQTGLCTSDSTYKVTLNFNATNPGNGTFTVSVHNQLIDTFNLSQVPLMLELPWNGQAGDFITICILGPNPTPGTNGCCRIKQFQVPNCLQPCSIFDIALDPGNCNLGSNTYNLHLDFETTNPGNAFFEVWGNGVSLGVFPLASLPIVIPNFPSNGNDIDIIKICINDHPDCCKAIEFQGPNCDVPCQIVDISVDPGDCNPNAGTYKLFLNFGVNNPGNALFEVFGNGVSLGVFPLASLPIIIPNFPSNGNAGDIIKICINDHPDCCETLEFQGPNCDAPCEIFDISVDPGACNPNAGTYKLHLNFGVNNPGNALFEVFGNGVSLGVFPLASLPIVIPNFPSNGNASDIIKICINDHPDCCETLEFQGPNCDAPCEIFDLTVETDDCHPADSTYTVRVNFQVQNPASTTFGLWANGQFFGNYDLSQLPLQINNFPWDGNGPNDVIKVCIIGNNGSLGCCRTIEFPAPNCYPGDCEVNDLSVDTGDCTGDSTYNLVVNFHVANSPSNVFSLWANGQLYGLFNVSQLPLTIHDFPWNGGIHDVIRVCFTNNPGGPGSCCAELEFAVPDCLLGAPCEIFDLTVTPGDCDPNAPTYPLTFDFEVSNPGNEHFEVWVNGTYFGTHLLSALPFTIPNAPSNGAAGDIIKVCINDQPNCCQFLEFPGPICNGGGGNCEIFDVVVDPGDCIPGTNTYNLGLNFQVANPGNNFFEVWGNGVYLGIFPLANLPLLIPNFPSNGAAMDIIKICINDHPDCCKVIEFAGPNCGGAGNCEIFDLVAETGDCTSDSTYTLKINFQFINATGNLFAVWANGQFFGNFDVNQLPLVIQDFPWDGGNFDGVKVCFVPNLPVTPCCAAIEFEVPDCLGNDDCHIYDLQVLRTPCLCGQFFAILTFQHENGGSGGFDILGNGNNYGNFPYDTTQPIILGPFPGDGTAYEFAVVDHNHPDLCGDEVNLGEVVCMNAVIDPNHGSAVLTLSPNPTADWLNVTALLENGATIGQANVELYATDGRLVQTNTVANGANFQLEVSKLPSGVYRLVLLSDSGKLEGTFAKQ